MKNSNGCFWKLIGTILAISFILAATSFYFSWINRFPELSGPKAVDFAWAYQGKNYSLKETYYQSVDTFYSKKEKGILVGQENSSIEKYLAIPSEDQSISQLSNDLTTLAAKSGLSKDQTADFTLSFVQAIPYDYDRAKTDLTHPRYPYEVLFDNLGICSDKSLLADVLLRKQNYGTSIFLFLNEEHMAVGIECPKNYSSFDSGFCFSETTAIGNKIGLIPELKSDNLQATSPQTLPTYNTSQTSTTTTKLSNPMIIAKTDGDTYHGIVQTIQLLNEISSLKTELGTLNTQINSDEQQLKNLGIQMEGYKSVGDVTTYNANVSVYNSLLSKVNGEISTYNSKVNRYNTLIKQFN